MHFFRDTANSTSKSTWQTWYCYDGIKNKTESYSQLWKNTQEGKAGIQLPRKAVAIKLEKQKHLKIKLYFTWQWGLILLNLVLVMLRAAALLQCLLQISHPNFHVSHILPPLHATKLLQHRNAPVFHENQSTLACPWNTHPSISSDLSRTKAESGSMAFRRLWRAFEHSQVDRAVKTDKMGSTVGAPTVPQHCQQDTAPGSSLSPFQGLQSAQQGAEHHPPSSFPRGFTA